MKRRSSLLKPNFVSLYVAAAGAVVLFLGCERWSSRGWYPIAVGLAAAAAIIPLVEMLEKALAEGTGSERARVVFFFILAIFAAASFAYVIREKPWLALGLLGMSCMFFWGAFGTIYQWPGFRKPIPPGRCHKCGYDLTGISSAICPECGTAIDDEQWEA